MRKKYVITLIILVVAAFFIGLIIVGNKKVSINADKVTGIEIFNGTNGKTAIINNKEDISKFVNEINSLSLKRKSVSLFKMGYRYRVTLYSGDRKMAGKWGSFIINDAELIRDDPFFYQVVDGAIDIGFLEDLFE